MSPLDEVLSLFRRGRFSEALTRLKATPIPADARLHADVVHAELLERLGQTPHSQQLIERIKRSRHLTLADQAVCEFVLGQIASEATGHVDQALAHLWRAVSLARQANDLYRLCYAQLRLMVMLADSTGPQSVAALLAELRWNCLRLGDPHVSAALHVFLAEAEAKRGLVETASRHNELAQRLLAAATSNPWLEGLAENTWVALAIMQSDLDAGLAHGRRALDLADHSGAAALKRAVLANLGNVHHLMGNADQAVVLWEQALAVLPTAGERSHAALESMAALYSAQGRTTEAEAILARIEHAVRTDTDAQLYANRHARLALAQLRGRQGSTTEAFATIDTVLATAERAGDVLLESHAHIARAELLGRGGAIREALLVLEQLATRLHELPPDVLARYECALAVCATADDATAEAPSHLRRARRIWSGLDNVAAMLEAERLFGHTAWHGTPSHEPPTKVGATEAAARAIVQEVSALLEHAGHPVLQATAVVDLLAGMGAVAHASAVARSQDGSTEILASWHAPDVPGGLRVAPTRTQTLGTMHGKTIEVTIQPRGQVETIAAVNAVTRLLRVVSDLEQSHAQREARARLWPSDELPRELDGVVIAGRMKDVITLARRVAPTPAGVLITGESGTGKDIVANEIHRCSARADKPFVAFNCAAVPKELVESLLFGHRRGAFTGADRDQRGMIRAAQGGTLFLDEVGDLSLDVQPKLLRFLEQGEISPLGEPQTVRVDVRIVAATNADLERMVQEGRFREDLFYRLNIVRLSIPPLRERRDEIPGLVLHLVAKAAVEYAKGALRVSDEAMEHLVLHRWPGNIRQLNNELRRSVALAEPDQILTPDDLSPDLRRALPVGLAGTAVTVPLSDTLTAALENVEREMIRAALRTHEGRVAQAAKALGISRKGLYLKRQRFRL